jgi:hypothetical protein
MYGIYEGGKVIARFCAPLQVHSNTPIFTTDALSLKRSTMKRSAHRWEISTNLEPLSYTANTLFSLFVRKGHFEPITVIMPQNFGVMMARTSKATGITATGAKGASSVSITGNLGKIADGTFVKFNSHGKIYMLTGDITGDGSVGVFPPLRLAVSGGMQHQDDVIGNFWIDTDTVTGMVYSDGILQDMGTVKLVEVV